MRRFFLKLLLFTLVGAAVNIAIAWGSHWIRPQTNMASSSTLPALYSDQQIQAMTRQEVEDAWAQISRERHHARSDHVRSERLKHEFETAKDHVLFLMGRTTRTESFVCGWPFRSFTCTATANSTGATTGPVDQGLRLSISNVTLIVPHGPMWRGLLLNTIFYALVSWFIVIIAGSLRRRLRTRRNLCPACAYPVGNNSICTECGKPVATTTASR